MGDDEEPLNEPVLQKDSTLSLDRIRSKMISFGLSHCFNFFVIPLCFLLGESTDISHIACPFMV